MSMVYHIGDLHLGHGNVTKWRNLPGVTSPENPMSSEQHDAWIVEQWNKTVTKRDTVFLHGDVVVYPRGLESLAKLNGNKVLIMGNHDAERHGLKLADYLPYFSKICALVARKGYWLSHAPIHPAELRGKPNIHGHVHEHSLPDPRYINVSIEGCWRRTGSIFTSAPQLEALMLARYPEGRVKHTLGNGRTQHSFFPSEGGHV